LYRYDIHDVVRCVGFEGEAPLVEFLNKGKSFSNITGEKLSEHQVIDAVERSFEAIGLALDAFTLAPVLEERPRYVLLVEPHVDRGRAVELARLVQSNLERANEEYAEKCSSGRLLPVEVRQVPAGTWISLRQEKTRERGNFEEYKQPCLVGDLEFAGRLAPPRHASMLAAETSATDI
jgi:hypothetical protein